MTRRLASWASQARHLMALVFVLATQMQAVWALEVPLGPVLLALPGKIGSTNQPGQAGFDLALLQRLPQHSFGTSGMLAVSIETRQLIDAQKNLFDAVIRLMADAIDAKSPYTGGHCERVPELATLLIDRLGAEIEHWQRLATGADSAASQADLTRRQQQLQNDFAFVAQCNVGGEFMADAAVARLQQLAIEKLLPASAS